MCERHGVPTAEAKFDNEKQSFTEFVQKQRQTRSKAAPGPNGVPYVSIRDAKM